MKITGIGDHQTPTLALEELETKLGLQRLDLMAHGTLSDAQLLRSARKALVACRGIE